MERTERLYHIESLLQRRRTVSFETLRDTLEVSPATLKRDLRHLRERLHAPITWDPEARGYRMAKDGGQEHHLPGVWFSAAEIHALLTLEQLVAQVDPAGVLADRLAPLRPRLQALLDGHEDLAEIRRRVRILGQARRPVQPRLFRMIGHALVRRQRLILTYAGRGDGTESRREVSPQRLAHYRDNWYLDAWCHLRNALRSFALDAIQEAEPLLSDALDVAENELDAQLQAGYGIFAGAQVHRARLRFSRERARWVAAEEWHPQQKGQWDAEGRWVLELPYSDPRELVMDILRHTPEVEVLGPPSLADEVRRRLRAGLARMGAG